MVAAAVELRVLTFRTQQKRVTVQWNHFQITSYLLRWNYGTLNHPLLYTTVWHRFEMKCISSISDYGTEASPSQRPSRRRHSQLNGFPLIKQPRITASTHHPNSMRARMNGMNNTHEGVAIDVLPQTSITPISCYCELNNVITAGASKLIHSSWENIL